MQHAEPVQEPFDFVSGRGELVVHALVADDHAAVVVQQLPGGAQHLDGPGHVVQRLEDESRVVRDCQLWVSGVAHRERDAVGDVGACQVVARLADRGLVEVETVDADLRVGAGECDARLAGAACDVGHAGRWVGLQAGVQIGHGGQPVGGEFVDEHRPVEVLDVAADVVTIVGVGDPVARAEGIEQVGQYLADRGYHVCRGGQEVGVVLVEQHVGVLAGQPVAARSGILGAVGLQVARDGLVLEPLAGDRRPRRASTSPNWAAVAGPWCVWVDVAAVMSGSLPRVTAEPGQQPRLGVGVVSDVDGRADLALGSPGVFVRVEPIAARSDQIVG